MQKNLVKFGCAVFELCERTDRHTDRQTDERCEVLKLKLSFDYRKCVAEPIACSACGTAVAPPSK